MRTLTSTLLIGIALTAGGTATYEAYQPHGAAWFNEGKLIPQQQQAEYVDQETGIIHQPTNHGNMDPPKYENNVYADFRATGPPQMDDYPKSPDEAAAKKSSSTTQHTNNMANYGYLKYWDNNK